MGPAGQGRCGQLEPGWPAGWRQTRNGERTNDLAGVPCGVHGNGPHLVGTRGKPGLPAACPDRAAAGRCEQGVPRTTGRVHPERQAERGADQVDPVAACIRGVREVDVGDARSRRHFDRKRHGLADADVRRGCRRGTPQEHRAGRDGVRAAWCGRGREPAFVAEGVARRHHVSRQGAGRQRGVNERRRGDVSSGGDETTVRRGPIDGVGQRTGRARRSRPHDGDAAGRLHRPRSGGGLDGMDDVERADGRRVEGGVVGAKGADQQRVTAAGQRPGRDRPGGNPAPGRESGRQEGRLLDHRAEQDVGTHPHHRGCARARGREQQPAAGPGRDPRRDRAEHHLARGLRGGQARCARGSDNERRRGPVGGRTRDHHCSDRRACNTEQGDTSRGSGRPYRADPVPDKAGQHVGRVDHEGAGDPGDLSERSALGGGPLDDVHHCSGDGIPEHRGLTGVGDPTQPGRGGDGVQQRGGAKQRGQSCGDGQGGDAPVAVVVDRAHPVGSAGTTRTTGIDERPVRHEIER